ncbi:hypothetical protein BH23VER1_BH23VER1_07110 [soil metagenome]
MKQSFGLVGMVALAALLGESKGAYLIQVDLDGVADAAVTFNPDFSFGNDTTSASASSASATSFGLEPGSRLGSLSR